MTDEKRPAAPSSDPNDTPTRERTEPDFYDRGEHDGWSPIVKRRRAPAPPPSSDEAP